MQPEMCMKPLDFRGGKPSWRPETQGPTFDSLKRGLVRDIEKIHEGAARRLGRSDKSIDIFIPNECFFDDDVHAVFEKLFCHRGSHPGGQYWPFFGTAESAIGHQPFYVIQLDQGCFLHGLLKGLGDGSFSAARRTVDDDEKRLHKNVDWCAYRTGVSSEFKESLRTKPFFLHQRSCENLQGVPGEFAVRKLSIVVFCLDQDCKDRNKS